MKPQLTLILLPGDAPCPVTGLCFHPHHASRKAIMVQGYRHIAHVRLQTI